MSEKEESDEEGAVGGTVHGENVNTENVNPAPSHPTEELFAEGNAEASGRISPWQIISQPAGTSIFPIPLPSFAPNGVASLPPVYAAIWYPSPQLYSPFLPYGITPRMPALNSIFRPLSMMQSSFSIRPDTPLTPPSRAMVADRKKKLTQASELCAEFGRANFGASRQPSNRGQRDAWQETEGDSAESDDFHNCSTTAGNEGRSAAAAAAYSDAEEDDDDEEVRPRILLRESSPGNAGISKTLTRSAATVVDLSSVQGDVGDLNPLGLYPSESYAMGGQTVCLGDLGNVKQLICSQPHCNPSPGGQGCTHCTTVPLNALGSNLPDPLAASAQLNGAVVGEAAPPDTGQPTDDDIHWRLCKICLVHYWMLVFIPCGHGSCKYCFLQLASTTCPFCRQRIRDIVKACLSTVRPLMP